MLEKIKVFFREGDERSIQAKKNILGSSVIKGISIAISLIMVPLTIHYISPSQYGVWLTLSSMVAWVSFFDIGFSNGLRNKFTEAKATGDHTLARAYVSTTYFYLTIIFSSVLLLFLIINRYIDWYSILNVTQAEAGNLSLLAAIVFSYFCISFVLRTISIIITADQKPAKASLIETFGQIIALISIFIMTKTTEGSILKVALAFCIAPIVVYSISTLFLFSKQYKNYVPSLKYVKKECAKEIMGLGVKFFIIQIAGIIQYQTATILIAKYFGMTEVTSYNIAFKYFGVLSMAFSIIISPFWSAVTDAHTRGDNNWIYKATNKYLMIFMIFILTGFLMLSVAAPVFKLWIGDIVHVSFWVSFWMLLYILSSMYSSIHVFILNGMGVIKLQFYICMISPILFIISTYFLVKVIHIGVAAILISSIVANFNGLIIAPLQYRYIKKGYKNRLFLS